MSKYNVLIVFVFGLFLFSSAQTDENLSSDEAYKRYTEISNRMESSFPENDIKTFRRNSFTGEELQEYLSNQFKRMDLLKSIEGQHRLKLNSYLHALNWFEKIGFPKESVKSYKKFSDYYEKHESELTDEEKASYVGMRTFALGILAESYAKLNKMDSAALYHEKNLDYTKSLDYVYYPSALNNYGLFYHWHKKEVDSALDYFLKARNIMKQKFPQHSLIGSIRDNIADVYVDTDRPGEALKLYRKNFKFFKTVNNELTLKRDVERLISAGAQSVQTAIRLNQLETAKDVINQLTTIVQNDTTNIANRPTSQLAYLNAKENLLYAQNNLEEAYATSKKLDDIATA